MSPKQIDGDLLKLIIKNGSINLKNKSQLINDLNVFPVPDGDTGSNMQSTMMSGVEAIDGLKKESVEKIGKALSRGLLMGARGNSGVILSQLFSGFAKAFNEVITANSVQFIEGLKLGVQQAYAAVINPVEGTILTVAREAVAVAETVATEDSDIIDVLEVYLKEAEASLQRTPDLLPILKESGVVDSGAAGLIVIVEGMISALRGEFYEETKGKADNTVGRTFDSDSSEFGYCTEFIIQLSANKRFNKDKFIRQLSRLGDSIVVVADEEICKVHIHTEKPGDALNLGQIYGEFANLKIENMTMQHSELLIHAEDPHRIEENYGKSLTSSFRIDTRKKFGIITVVNGEGLKEMFREMGVDYIIDGGQTMNPATQDFIDAIDQVNADNIIIIPNNKNVFLSAEHAAKNVEEKNVIVLPAKTIAQGYASLTMFDANQEPEDAIEEMNELIEHVKSGEITYAVRDTEINGFQIKKDDYLGLKDGKIVLHEADRYKAVTALLETLIDDESEIITLMVGLDVEEEEVTQLKQHVTERYPDVELEVIEGEQEIYTYLIAVE